MQLNNNGLIASASKVVNILGQLKGLPEAPGNSPTITLGLIPYARGHRKGFIPEHEGGLPPNSKRG